MSKRLTAGALAALMIAATSPAALAQTTLTGIRDLDDRIDDIDEAARDDLRRAEDAARFGNPEFRPGLSGSASLSYNAKDGNQDTQEFSLGARLRWAQGNFAHQIGLALDFAEADGSKSKEDIFGVYDAQYYFDPSLYAFVLGRVKTDGLAETADEVRTDAFIGFGPGYRVVNNNDMTWRLQAGIGASYIKNGIGESETDPGYIASSRFYWRFNENVFLTNDTDVLKADGGPWRVNNDLGLNFRMTDRFSTRVSYLTDYNEDRAIRTDNKLGVSLVYSF